MPRKPQATIVEDFDDDTDLPLPSRPLPNTGTKGALIKSVDSDDSDPESDDDDDVVSLSDVSPRCWSIFALRNKAMTFAPFASSRLPHGVSHTCSCAY